MSTKTFYGEHNVSLLPLLDKDRNEKDSYCDAVLQVKGEKLNVHRCLLGSLSSYFNKMFKCEMKEKYDRTVDLTKFSAETIKTILDFFYTTKVTITEENALPLLEAADYFFLHELKKFCAKFLISTLTIINCLDLRSSGKVFQCELLRTSCESVVLKNFKKVLKQPSFKTLSCDDMEAIIQALDQKTVGSKPVYEGIVIWVHHDYCERKSFFDDLFKYVKLHLLSTEYLQEIVAQQELVKSSHVCKDHLLNETLYAMKHQNRKAPVFESSSSSENEDNDESENCSIKKLDQELETFQLDTPSSEVTSGQPSKGGIASRTGESKELAIEKQELLKKVSQEEMDSTKPHQKKIYDRTFLMQFGFNNSSLEKHLDLPIIEDIIMDENQQSSSTSKKRRKKKTQPKKAETPGTSSHQDPTPSTASTKNEQSNKVLRQNVQSILYKMTPSNLLDSIESLKLISLNTEARLCVVVKLVFRTAVKEPDKSALCASVCQTMSSICVPSCQPGKTTSFIKTMVSMCQRELEKDREILLSKYPIEVEKAKTLEEMQNAEEGLDKAETKERGRMLGNIRFMGELFKLGILSQSLMHNCILTLLKLVFEESLELFCHLLTAIAKDFKSKKRKNYMDQYFTQINKIIQEGKISDRVKFMLMNLVELRQNNWVQRADKVQDPTTIDQIHADTMEENKQLAFQVAEAATPPLKPQTAIPFEPDPTAH